MDGCLAPGQRCPSSARAQWRSEGVQLQIEELAKVVGQLAEQVAMLTAKQNAKDDEIENPQARGERAYHRFLANLPEVPRFTPTKWVPLKLNSTGGARWVVDQPSYESRSVDDFVTAVGSMAAKRKLLPRLQAYLNMPDDLDKVGEDELGVDADPSNYMDAYHRTEVDRYIIQMRECVRSYFTQLAETPSPETP